MSRFIKIIFVALCAAFISAMNLQAQSPDKLRIYINPGHGGWTGDDRPCSLVNHPEAFSRTNTDTCSFFESNTDLEKGFGLLERLIEYGLPFDRTKNQSGVAPYTGAARDLEQNIVMSRVKNGPYFSDNATAGQYGTGKVPAEYYWYNRNLTEICEEVQVNNFDMFISIHSNAANAIYENYPLYLYRGYDDCHADDGNTVSHQTTSRKMSEMCWGYGYENPHSYWSRFKTSTYIKGDIDFYGDYVISTRSDGQRVKGYLGALRHSVPGFLVEGYFHSYEPARHRAMNWDVCRVEGFAYAHGIADFFGLEKESFGTIYGIVRDSEEKFTHQWYHPASDSDDLFKPLNGAMVELLKDGEKVADYITDSNYNGAFVFDGLEEGIYTIEISLPGYEKYSGNVEVKAAGISYPKCFVQKKLPYSRAGFVYGLRSEQNTEGNATLFYSLSADVEQAQVLIVSSDSDVENIDYDEVEVYDVDSSKGDHSFPVEIYGSGSYKWGVRITTFENSEAGEVFADPSGLTTHRGGVVPITDRRYESFGYTLVSHGNNQGIDIYAPDGRKVASRYWKGHELWGTSSTTSNYDPCRGNQRQGKAVFASWGDNVCGVVAVDPLMKEEPQAMYAGLRQKGGHYIYNGINVGGGVSGLCFVGDGDETFLYTFSEDHEGMNGAGSTENSIVRYPIGSAWLVKEAPEVIGFKSLLANYNVDMITYKNGIFAVQNRAAGMNTPDIPSFIYLETNGHSVTYNSGTSLKSLNQSTMGLAITEEGSTLAVSDASSINIYDVEWNGSTPSITFNYRIPTGASQSWVNLRFDAAGNLHSYQVGNGGYHVYALKSPGTTTTQFSDVDVLAGSPTIVSANGEEGPARYFNLLGIEIPAESIAPGIYIKVQGSRASKIRIK